METDVPNERIDSMLRRLLGIASEVPSEDDIRLGIVEVNPCGHSALDQVRSLESADIKAAMTREQWDAEMVEHIVECYRLLLQNQPA